jgi:hypothetical protein
VPTFINPKFVHVETGGGSGGGGLVVAGVAVVAAGAAAAWVVRELLSMWAELAIIAGGTAVVMGTWLVWMAIHFNRGSLPVNAAAKAEAITASRAAAVTAGETRTDNRTVHHHYDERQLHYHDNRTVNVHQAPASEQTPPITARKVVQGIVLGPVAPAGIEARKAPLYRIPATEHHAIEEQK